MKYFVALLLCLSVHAEALRLRVETPRQLTAEDVAQNVASVTANGAGCCVTIGKHELLTAAHVVNGGVVTVEVDGDWKAAKVIKIDIMVDLALLETDATLKRHYKVADDKALRLYAGARGGEIEDAAVTMKAILVNHEAADGNSGAPVMDGDGKIAAIVSGHEKADKPTWLWCIPANVIRDFLKD